MRSVTASEGQRQGLQIRPGILPDVRHSFVGYIERNFHLTSLFAYVKWPYFSVHIWGEPPPPKTSPHKASGLTPE